MRSFSAISTFADVEILLVHPCMSILFQILHFHRVRASEVAQI